MAELLGAALVSEGLEGASGPPRVALGTRWAWSTTARRCDTRRECVLDSRELPRPRAPPAAPKLVRRCSKQVAERRE